MYKLKKKNTAARRGAQVTAVAVLAAALIAGNVQPSMVQGDEFTIEMCDLLPDEITIDEPVPLYEIELPESEYGEFFWEDDECVPSQWSESFDVVFEPYDDVDISRFEEWDGESDEIYSSVTVIVSSLEDSDEEESYEEESGEGESYDESAETPEAEPTETPEAEPTETPEAAPTEIPEAEPTETPEAAPTEIPEAEPTETPEAEPTETPEAEPTETPEAEPTETPEAVLTETPEAEPTETPEAAPTETPEAEPTETPEAAPTETPDADPTPAPTEDEDNIFDRPDDPVADDPVADDRPVIVEDELTEEEMQQMAEINHTSNGITVSGSSLPWYVQFRATSGETFAFTNRARAEIFKSYEFELWDLKNNTEYEIPDGEYVSVTIPVKAGYDYVVEHLLDNGAIETIIPTVTGSTLVFSTHSFSPFGIAGSQPIIGGDIMEDNYNNPTTPAPTQKPTTPSKPSTGGSQQGGSSTGNSSTSGSSSNTTGSSGSSGNKGSGSSSSSGNNLGSGNSGSSSIVPGNNNSSSTGSGNNGSSSTGSGNNGSSSTGSGNNGSSSTGSGNSNSSSTGSGNSSSNSSGSGSNNNYNNNSNSSSSNNNYYGNSNSQGRYPHAVNTGDSTPVVPFVILGIAAIVIIGAIIFLKTRKR